MDCCWPPVERRARPLLGTVVELVVRTHAPAGALQGGIERAFACITQVQALMSAHDPDSELSRLNRTALERPVPVQAHTRAVLAAALALAAASDGAFDPCVAPELERRGLLPDHGGGATDPRADWRDIELQADGRVRFHRPLRIDLGGIAKGYAVDLALAALLTELPEADLMVNAGGDLRAAGAAQEVVLRDPASGRPGAAVVRLEGQALASSARQPGASGRHGHLVDRRHGTARQALPGVSVIAADCISADALTKVVLFAPPALAAEVLRAHGARALVQADARPA